MIFLFLHAHLVKLTITFKTYLAVRIYSNPNDSRFEQK